MPARHNYISIQHIFV